MLVTFSPPLFGEEKNVFIVLTTTNCGVSWQQIFRGNRTQCLMLVDTFERIGFEFYQRG